MLQKHVEILEGEQELKNNHDELARIIADLRRITPSGGQLYDSDLVNISRFEQQRDELKAGITAAENTVAEAKKQIMFRVCEQ